MISIRKKINRLVVFSLITISVFMMGLNIVLTNYYANKSSTTMLKESCSSQNHEMNNQFKLVEQAVHNIFRMSETVRPMYSSLKSLRVSNGFIEQFKTLAYAITENTEGAMSVYYRLNPELNGDGKQGFFYVKNMESGVFSENEITDLLEYDPSDVEHVGWYYAPLKEGRPVWMNPYYNANIGVEMISYVMPIYDNGMVVGVIGMDVDFERLLNITENINIYDNCGAVLLNIDSTDVYYNKCDIFGQYIPTDLYYRVISMEDAEDVFDYSIDGVSYKMYYETLSNGMKILLYAATGDINRQRNDSLILGGIVFVVVFALTLLLATRISRRITGPISAISEATKKYAKGEWTATVTCDTNDELKELTDNISTMAEKTKEYIDYINNLAKEDSLTGLRNKTAYTQFVEKLKNIPEMMEKGYAVVVCDVNNLKYINDNYGHEKGDELLKAAGMFICKNFVHSPVFRIGGDEFVSILYTNDYKDREDLIKKFQEHMSKPKNKDDVNDVSIASGMAVFPEEAEDYESVFALADQRMYQNKKILKSGDLPR